MAKPVVMGFHSTGVTFQFRDQCVDTDLTLSKISGIKICRYDAGTSYVCSWGGRLDELPSSLGVV
jgi:hypothetical protein